MGKREKREKERKEVLSDIFLQVISSMKFKKMMVKLFLLLHSCFLSSFSGSSLSPFEQPEILPFFPTKNFPDHSWMIMVLIEISRIHENSK